MFRREDGEWDEQGRDEDGEGSIQLCLGQHIIMVVINAIPRIPRFRDAGHPFIV